MKRLLIIPCVFLFALNLWATNVKIHLYMLCDKGEDCRSISINFSASYDGKIIFLNSDFPIDELEVTIRDKTGNILSTETISIFPEQPYTFSIEELKNGIYILELNDGKREYAGYFEKY